MLVAVPSPMDRGIAESPTRESDCEATSFSAATATS